MEIKKNDLEWLYKQRWDEDLLQDTLERILEHEGEVEDFRAWATTVYYNVLRDHTRKATRRRELAEGRKDEMGNLHGRDDVSDPIEYVEFEEVMARMEDLSPLLKETLQRYIEGETIKEIAVAQGVAENVIYQRIWQAKKEILNV